MKNRRSYDEWLLDHSATGEMLKKLNDFTEVLNDHCDDSAERGYREIMFTVLTLLALRTERLLLFLGVLLGGVIALLLR